MIIKFDIGSTYELVIVNVKLIKRMNGRGAVIKKGRWINYVTHHLSNSHPAKRFLK